MSYEYVMGTMQLIPHLMQALEAFNKGLWKATWDILMEPFSESSPNPTHLLHTLEERSHFF